jgi:hypothetical protein
MIGNAVPPPLAEALGRELLKTLVSQFERGSNMPFFTRRSSVLRPWPGRRKHNKKL